MISMDLLPIIAMQYANSILLAILPKIYRE